MPKNPARLIRRRHRISTATLPPELHEKRAQALGHGMLSHLLQLGVEKLIENEGGNVNDEDLGACATSLQQAADLKRISDDLMSEVERYIDAQEDEEDQCPE
jgi:hypothetical protein